MKNNFRIACPSCGSMLSVDINPNDTRPFIYTACLGCRQTVKVKNISKYIKEYNEMTRSSMVDKTAPKDHVTFFELEHGSEPPNQSKKVQLDPDAEKAEPRLANVGGLRAFDFAGASFSTSSSSIAANNSPSSPTPTTTITSASTSTTSSTSSSIYKSKQTPEPISFKLSVNSKQTPSDKTSSPGKPYSNTIDRFYTRNALRTAPEQKLENSGTLKRPYLKKPSEQIPVTVQPLDSEPDEVIVKIEDRPRKDERKEKKSFIINSEKRLKVASVLMLIVFILGIFHGVNSLIHGSFEPVISEYEKPDYVDIHGRVIDNETGRPIANCIITVMDSNQGTRSNRDGQFFIPNIKSGNHDIKAEAGGYINIVKSVTVDPELMGIINFELDDGVGVIEIDESVSIKKSEEAGINSFGILIIMFACFALIAVMLIKRRAFFLVCSICAFISVLSIGASIGIVVGMIALVLVLTSAKSFHS